MPNLTADSVYDFYAENLFPAIWASLPLLLARISTDLQTWLSLAYTKTIHFLLPWTRPDWESPWNTTPSSLVALWESSSNSTVAEFMLRHLDTNQDGHISPSELFHFNDLLETIKSQNMAAAVPQTWLSWFSRSWPLLDWKLSVFLWKSCSGLLLVIAIASLMPGRLHGYAGRLLRWPVLGLTYFIIFVELVVYIVIRLFIRLVETLIASPKHRSLRRKMTRAKSYEEWYELAQALDKSQGRQKWQQATDDDTSYRYNWSFVKELQRDLQLARERKDSLFALAVLQQCTRKNVGGIMSEEIFCYTHTGEPKAIVREFLDEVVATLKWVTNEALEVSPESTEQENSDYERRLSRKVAQEKTKIMSSILSWATLSFPDSKKTPVPKIVVEGMPASSSSSQDSNLHQASSSSQASSGPQGAVHKDQLVRFLKSARAAYGRTALVLSGGAMMGNYHWGHAKGLLENNALPHIISGTSAGSVIGAILCTRTDEEIERDMRPEVLCNKLKCFSRPWPDRIRSLWRTGHLFDFDEWYEMIQWFTLGDMTFEEAHKKTGRIFCITLSATTKKAPPVLLNYISAPNVVIASAIIATAAVPGFVPPVRLRVKDADGTVRPQGKDSDELYWDGSIEQDIPTAGLAEMLNCHFFVAAQCNPHIVPFFYNAKGAVGMPMRWSSGKRGDSWRGGFLLSALELYLKSDMRAKFHFLNDLEAAVGFTSTLMTQTYEGSTTLVPQVALIDYFKLFTNPNLKDMHRYFQAGSVSAYQHCAMIKLHYNIADALDECLERLGRGRSDTAHPHPPEIGLKPARLLASKYKTIKELDCGEGKRRISARTPLSDTVEDLSQTDSDSSSGENGWSSACD